MANNSLEQAKEKAKEQAALVVEDPEKASRNVLSHPFSKAVLPFVVGGGSGMVGTTIIQPIDMVKVRLQLLGEGSRGGPSSNPFTVAKNIIAKEGLLSLYNGLSAGLLRQAVYATARLGFFSTFEDMLKQRAATKGTEIGFAERSACGLAAGALAAMIGNPAEVGLIRMQSDGLKPKGQRANYRSVFDVLIRVSKNEGVLALWNGCFPTVLRAMATNFGQLAFFSETKNQIRKRTELSEQTEIMTASAVAGFFAAFFGLPFDFVKTRLQRQTRGPDGSYAYNGMWDCFVKVTKNEGLLRFYRGFWTYFVRIAPHTVITLTVADNINRLIKRHQD